MKAILSTLMLSMAMLVLGFNTALAADKVPDNALPMMTILKNLKTDGYLTLKEVEFDDGVYKAKGVNAQGQRVKVRINPQTGKLIKPKDIDDKKYKKIDAMIQAVQHVEAAGYTHIYEIETERNSYEVKAIDKDGKKVRLDVNASTGKVSKDWF